MILDGKKTLKARLGAGETLLGTFFKLDSLQLAEILGYTGFDFIIVDGEHSNFSYRDMEQVVRAANSVGMSAVVRVPSALEQDILHAGDMGAQGIQIPGLRTAAEASTAVSQMRYYPLGVRGFSMAGRAARYTFCPKDTYVDYVNHELLSVVMVENTDMVEQVPELCKDPNIDVLFVGTGDLSQSLGLFGQTKHPRVREIVRQTAEQALAAGKYMGVIAADMEDVEIYYKMGVRYIALTTDVAMIVSALRETKDRFYSTIKKCGAK